ncbi:MAG: MEDS domain-containing protein [Deltaproteobacteria bacterium]|nr:MEDS domain-containing protein [Deltaproteobacteria bacterium]
MNSEARNTSFQTLWNSPELRQEGHIACFYETRDQYFRILTSYLVHGLKAGEKVLYFAADHALNPLLSDFKEFDFDPSEYLQTEQLIIIDKNDQTIPAGHQYCDKMADWLKNQTEYAMAHGFRRFRLVEDVIKQTSALPCLDHLVDYADHLNDLTRKRPFFALCMFDLNRVDSDNLVNALRAHPLAVVRGQILKNAYYIPPEQLTSRFRGANIVRYRMTSLYDRYQQRRAIQLSEEKYRALAEGIPDIIIRFNRNLQHEYISSSISRYIDIFPMYLVGKSHKDIGLPEEISEYWEKQIRQVFDTGRSVETDFELSGIKGTFMFNWRVFPEFDTDGTVNTVISIARDITATQKAEKEFRNLFNKMLDGFAVHEIICNAAGLPIDYRFLAINPAFTQMTGLTEQDIIGKTALEIMPYIESFRIQTYWNVAINGESAHFEQYNREFDRFFKVTAYQHAPGQFACIFSDITQRKQADAERKTLLAISELFMKEKNIRAIYDNVPEILSENLLFPLAAVVLYDKYSEEMVFVATRGFPDALKHEIRVPLCQSISGTVVKTREPLADFQADKRNEHASGVLKALNIKSIISVPLMISDRVLGTVTLADVRKRPNIRDLIDTLMLIANHLAQEIDRKLTSESLHKTKNELEFHNRIATIFLTAFDNTLFFSVLELVLEATQSQHGYFGYIDLEGNLSIPAITRSIFGSGRMPDKNLSFQKQNWKGLRGKSLIEKKCLYSNGPFNLPEDHQPISCALFVPIIYQDKLIGQFAVANKADGYAEEDRLMLKALSEYIAPLLYAKLSSDNSRKQLEQTQRMESIGVLAGGIAHDFNNILFPIIGNAEMLIDDFPEYSPVNNKIKQILKAAMRAQGLVQQILAFSRQQVDERVPIRLKPIISEVMKLLRSSLPSTITFTQDLSRQQSCLTLADPTQVHQILMNLCTNAFHAMQESGGNLHVSLEEVTISPNDYTGTFDLLPGKYNKLSVRDTGHGMPKHIQEKIFDPYYTTKGKDKGTGLGLSVVHGIVKSCKGHISVDSEIGKGSQFDIYLPVCDSESNGISTKTTEIAPRGTEHILLVDDEDPIVILIDQMLTRLGYQVTSRSSSPEALDAFISQPDLFDLVITDMTMPYLTGIQLARKMMDVRPDIPVVLCTGFSERITENTVKQLGIRKLILKPVIRMDLAKTIRSVLDKRA